MWEGSTLGNTIPRQVVLDCVRNLAAHEPESQGESKPAHSARPWLLILVPSTVVCELEMQTR